jgi:death-on-curing family protein
VEILSVEEVEEVAFEVARQHFEFDEPIPDFSSRFPGILEGCLAVPFQAFFKQDAYPTLATRASILFYLMIKDHPFQNGNKRIAIATLLVFLLRHKKWLEVDTKDLYDFTVRIAESKPKEKNFVVAAITGLIVNSMVDAEWEDTDTPS